MFLVRCVGFVQQPTQNSFKKQLTDGPICPKIANFGPPKTGTRQWSNNNNNDNFPTIYGCIVCVQMKLYQSTYNRSKGKLLKQLKQEVDSLRLGSRSRRIAFLDKYNKYKEESNTSNTVSDALKEVHCKSVPVLGSDKDLYHINCAFNRCDRCPKV